MRGAAGRRGVIGRDDNVLRVDFGRKPDPPTPRFPGAGALRQHRFEQAETPAFSSLLRALPAPG